LHFCDYLPFEEELVLYFYNFEIPLPKDDLYHVWLKLACWFWRRFVFQHKHIMVNYGFPVMAPSDPPGPWFEEFESTLCQKYDLSSSVVHEKIFKWPHPIFLIISPLKRNWSLQTCEFVVQMSEIKLSFYDPVVLDKKNSEYFFYI
jgi:hypothetical protein